jgi:hypothetical protein
MQEKKKPKAEQGIGLEEPDTPYRRASRLKWAALIKLVFEVDPLKCPNCGGTMRIVSFIDEDPVIQKILKHCNLWKEHSARAPPAPESSASPAAMTYDPDIFNTLAG